jgi:hypothetical protein
MHQEMSEAAGPEPRPTTFASPGLPAGPLTQHLVQHPGYQGKGHLFPDHRLAQARQEDEGHPALLALLVQA